MIVRATAWAGLLVLVLSSCGASSPGLDLAEKPDGGSREDFRADGAAEGLDGEAPPRPDEQSSELPPAEEARAETDGNPFVPNCRPGEGCFLDKCSQNEACQSGWCVEHLGEGVCSRTCQEECPPGWSCKLLAGEGPDAIYLCVSDHANLCRPCAAASDCKSVGGAEPPCVSYGPEGSFCGGACGADEECPWGFSCKEVETTEGVSLSQCFAEAGVCPCTSKSVSLGLSTPCEVGNDWGTCQGKRVCASDGLQPCDALLPSEEVCNGLDDDCNGEVDEGHFDGEEYQSPCDDGNNCTKDVCDGAAGCLHSDLDSGECFDGDSCTIGDHCEQGECTGTPISCDDKNPCTDDSCTSLGGCEFAFNLADCDDGDPCTVADECGDGVCAGTQIPCDCLADGDCAIFEDGDLCNGTLLCDTAAFPFQCKVAPETIVECPIPDDMEPVCLAMLCDPGTGKCQQEPAHEGFACSDGDACTLGDVCAAGACVAKGSVACSDGNPCTDDSCVPQVGCTYKANAAPCDDGNACSTGDHCAGGQCAASAALDCDDGNPCTADGCGVATGCTHTPQPGACDDSDPCTVNDSCKGGQCQPGAVVTCNDGNPCTDDSCGDQGICLFSPQVGSCDDGNKCTTGDKCSAGKCSYAALLSCDDSNLCTDDSCDPEDGCLHKLNKAPCDDANVCSTGDHCQLGACVPSGQIACNDGNKCTDDSCNPKVGCEFLPNAAPCDDGNACTVGDVCSQAACAAGPAPADCNDSDPCTDDSCDPKKGCLHAHNKAPCSDDDACTQGEYCSLGVCGGGVAVNCLDSSPCTDDSCHPVDGCVHKNNSAACSDNDACTDGDLCADGQCKPGKKIACDDGNVCTTDLCKPATGCDFAPVPDKTPCAADKVCVSGVCQTACETGTMTFNYTGGMQTWVAPPCVTSVEIEAYGAQGCGNADPNSPKPGPLGGKAAGKLAVTPGTTLYVFVGGSGDSGGWNGGGGINGGYPKGRGGGASDVRLGGTGLADRKIVGGGAGAHAPYSLGYGGWHQAAGGAGGGLSGEPGQNSNGNPPPACGGGAGTQNGGGAAGCDVGGNPSSAGASGQGGNGGGENDNDPCGAGGGGGGGWYGGGGGGHHNCGGGGGGGGSSYLGGVSDGNTQSGVRAGHGLVVIKY
jgi:hypothetical protein